VIFVFIIISFIILFIVSNIRSVKGLEGKLFFELIGLMAFDIKELF